LLHRHLVQCYPRMLLFKEALNGVHRFYVLSILSLCRNAFPSTGMWATHRICVACRQGVPPTQLAVGACTSIGVSFDDLVATCRSTAESQTQVLRRTTASQESACKSGSGLLCLSVSRVEVLAIQSCHALRVICRSKLGI
jgi:hypothetical protein